MAKEKDEEKDQIVSIVIEKKTDTGIFGFLAAGDYHEATVVTQDGKSISRLSFEGPTAAQDLAVTAFNNGERR